MKQFDIIRLKNNNKETISDFVAEEISLTIDVNKNELVTILCSEDSIKDLAVGYLYTSGIINNIEEIKNICVFRIIKEKWMAYVELVDVDKIKNVKFKKIQPVGCGKGTILINESDNFKDKKITSNLKIEKDVILSLMKEFQVRSQTFKQTGGVHSAALVEKDKIIVFSEDIGRHNAIDKVIGNMIINNKSLENKIILTSGRISSEILIKVQKCEIPVIITRSAPTDMAINICRENNITLAGFVRGNRMNIYSGEDRILT